MATCIKCEQEMTRRVACTWKPTVLIDQHPAPEFNGAPYERIPFHADRNPDGCRDCGTPPDALHHPGCDTERCPACHWQAISCGCRWEGDEYEPEDD